MPFHCACGLLERECAFPNCKEGKQERIIMEECRKQFEEWKEENWMYVEVESDAYEIWKAAWNRRAEAQWQPIETAPKELGKRILGLKDCGEGTLTSISIMFWLNDGGWHLNDCATRTAEGFGYRVTHWMPLPAAQAEIAKRDVSIKEYQQDLQLRDDHIAEQAARIKELEERRCEICGYAEHHREHTGCLRVFVDEQAAEITRLKAMICKCKDALEAWNRRAEQVPEEFDHSIGEGRFYVVQGAYWWHVRVGTGQKNIGAFHTKAKAEEMAMDFLIAFRDGAFAQYQAMLAAAPEVKS